MTTPILDEPLAAPPRTPLARRIFVGLEIALWILVLFALLFKMESWEGGSELLILGMGSLSMLYLLLPIVLFGSRGWRQHLGSHAAGFALMMGIWGVLFSMESWAYHAEMLVLGLPFVLLLAITTTILWLVRRSQPGGASFYRNASLRLIPVLCLLAFYVL